MRPSDPKKCVTQEMLPDFLDFVVWGHEHEAKSGVEEGLGPDGTMTIYQPGSTVATSLCEAESLPKHVGILEIYKDTLRFRTVKLKTVRPFMMRTIVLSEELDPSQLRKIENVERKLAEKVNEMIDEAAQSHQRDPEAEKANPKLHLPLIRLRVELPPGGTSNEQIQAMSIQKFGQQFVEKVANPQDLLLFTKPRKPAPHKNGRRADDSAADGGGMGFDQSERDLNRVSHPHEGLGCVVDVCVVVCVCVGVGVGQGGEGETWDMGEMNTRKGLACGGV